MKPTRTKLEPDRTPSIDIPQDLRFADSPALAALVAKMASALERRKHKTSWMTDAVRAEMLRRYTDLLDDPNEAAQRDFMRWVVDDARYLAAEGNFEEFCHMYLMAEVDEVSDLWDMAGEGPH